MKGEPLIEVLEKEGLLEDPAKEKIWECKIGVTTKANLPNGADAPMRDAVARAFEDVTGHPAQEIFSGWAAEFDLNQICAIENRLPTRAEDMQKISELQAEIEMIEQHWENFDEIEKENPRD